MNTSKLTEQAESSHREGDLRRAQELYRQALQVDLRNTDAHYGLATALMQDGKHEEAQRYFESATELEPDAPDIAYNYALCLARLGSSDRAIEKLDNAYSLCDGDPYFLEPIAKALLELNNPSKALQVLSELAAHSSRKVLLSAQAYGQLSDWGRAVSLLEDLFDEQPDSQEIARELSLAAARLRDYPLAIESMQRCLSLADHEASDLLRLADLYLMARQLDQAEATLDKVFTQDNPGGECWALRARTEQLRGNYQQAINSAEEALKQIPCHGLMWRLLVELTDEEFLPELQRRMEAVLDQEATSDFHTTMTLYVLGNLNDKLGERASAISRWHEANSRQRKHLTALHRDYDFEATEKLFARSKSQYSKLHAGKKDSNFKPIFIAGMPRSGTTLVERILGQIEGVENCGENEAMALIASQYGHDVQQGRLPVPSKMSAEQWQTLATAYQNRTPHRSSTITDKLPANVQYVGVILSCFANARVVLLRRNPVAVCWSIYQRYFPGGHNYACDFRTLAHYFRQTDALIDHWSAVAGDRVLVMEYEQLVSDAESQARKLVKYCDLQWSDECLKFHEQIHASFTFSEMQVRKPIDNSRIEQWKAYDDFLEPLKDALRDEGYRLD